MCDVIRDENSVREPQRCYVGKRNENSRISLPSQANTSTGVSSAIVSNLCEETFDSYYFSFLWF